MDWGGEELMDASRSSTADDVIQSGVGAGYTPGKCTPLLIKKTLPSLVHICHKKPLVQDFRTLPCLVQKYVKTVPLPSQRRHIPAYGSTPQVTSNAMMINPSFEYKVVHHTTFAAARIILEKKTLINLIRNKQKFTEQIVVFSTNVCSS